MIICGSCNSKFPLGTFHTCHQQETKLRDQLAMAALTGLLSNPNTKIPFETEKKIGQLYSEIAYVYADSMLQVRKNN